MKKRYLILENNMIFEGYAFGADKENIGELVFTTGTGGYTEALTDPAAYGAILLQTFPLIGNYGINEDDFEGKCCLNGYVVREYCDAPSNFRCQYDIDTFLKNNGVPGIYGVDTRQIMRVIRDCGEMNAKICDEIPQNIDDIKNFKVVDAIKNVTTKENYVCKAEGEKKLDVVVIDYGTKKAIAEAFTKRGCDVTVVSAETSAEDILAMKPDGVILSSGAGVPDENKYCIEQIAKLYGKVPMMGICLGHLMLALACGNKVEKMKYGHRGENQPVKDTNSPKTYVTVQSHGYVVNNELKAGKVSYINVNDKTCEGIDYEDAKAFSVQFHPEACGGPLDTLFLLDRFVEMMKEDK